MFVTTTVGVGSPGISRDGEKRASWLATAHCQTAAGQGGQRRTPPPVWLPKPSQSRFALLNTKVTLLPHEGVHLEAVWDEDTLHTYIKMSCIYGKVERRRRRRRRRGWGWCLPRAGSKLVSLVESDCPRTPLDCPYQDRTSATAWIQQCV